MAFLVSNTAVDPNGICFWLTPNLVEAFQTVDVQTPIDSADMLISTKSYHTYWQDYAGTTFVKEIDLIPGDDGNGGWAFLLREYRRGVLQGERAATHQKVAMEYVERQLDGHTGWNWDNVGETGNLEQAINGHVVASDYRFVLIDINHRYL